jgi:hypothetical protein
VTGRQVRAMGVPPEDSDGAITGIWRWLMRRFAVAVLVAMLAAPMLGAETLAGVTMPDEVTVSGKALKLNGMGLRKKLVVKVYVAGLYLEHPSHEAAQVVAADEIKRVDMHFLTGQATKARMDEAWLEGFQKNSPADYQALKERVETFMGYFPDMKDGDVIELTMVPGEGTTAALNGEVKGTIAGDDFAAALLRVWLGEEPPSKGLQRGLLGLK